MKKGYITGKEEFEPTSIPPSTKDIIATGGDLFGAISLFTNPLVRFFGNIYNARDIVSKEEDGRDYVKEAEQEIKEKLEFQRNRAYEDAMRMYDFSEREWRIKLMEKEYKSRGKKNDKERFSFHFNGPDIDFKPKIDNSSKVTGGGIDITNDSYKGNIKQSQTIDLDKFPSYIDPVMEAARTKVVNSKESANAYVV